MQPRKHSVARSGSSHAGGARVLFRVKGLFPKLDPCVGAYWKLFPFLELETFALGVEIPKGQKRAQLRLRV